MNIHEEKKLCQNQICGIIAKKKAERNSKKHVVPIIFI